MPQKLFVPLKIGNRSSARPPLAECSKIVCPFCITRTDMPRLLSEYLAARAQSLGLIPAAHAMVDPTMVSARANRIGERTLAACRRWHSAIVNFSLTLRFVDSLRRTKVRFAGTPKPARDARALPRMLAATRQEELAGAPAGADRGATGK